MRERLEVGVKGVSGECFKTEVRTTTIELFIFDDTIETM
jgi:hypothetical protein